MRVLGSAVSVAAGTAGIFFSGIILTFLLVLQGKVDHTAPVPIQPNYLYNRILRIICKVFFEKSSQKRQETPFPMVCRPLAVPLPGKLSRFPGKSYFPPGCPQRLRREMFWVNPGLFGGSSAAGKAPPQGWSTLAPGSKKPPHGTPWSGRKNKEIRPAWAPCPSASQPAEHDLCRSDA